MQFRPFFLLTMICFWASAALAQTITGFTPPYGDPGTTSVTVTGSGFLGATSVTIGGVVCPSGTWQVSDQTGTQIVAYVPSTAVRGTVSPIIVKKSASQAASVDNFRVLPAGPFIASFSPTNAAVGSSVIITGAHFNGATLTGVKFNGTSAGYSNPTTDTELICTVPSGGTTGFITVNATTGSYTTTNYFYYQPGVQSFSPFAGRPGTNVVIKGTNFFGVTRVSFGGIQSTNFTTNSNTQITATVPTGASTGTLNVVAPAGQFISISNFVVQPDITSISPIAGNVNTTVTINGVNMGGSGLVVRFNGVVATTFIGTPTATQITVLAPSGTTSGPITVQTADGTGTSPTNFFYPPFISSISPTNGVPGTTVTISGQNLTNTLSVSFNGANATNFTVVNNNTVTAVVPAAATSGQITITTPYGPVSSAQSFILLPIVTSFSPRAGVIGVPVNISGSNFSFSLGVSFNGTAATTWSNVNDKLIVAHVPAGASTGPISVRTYGGTGVSTNSFIIDPVVLSISNVDVNTVAISWTTNALGFNLQSTTNVSGSWSNEVVAPVISGGQQTVTNTTSSPQKYYRLRN